HRPRARFIAQAGRAGRAGLRARRVDPRADPQSLARPAGAARPILSVHRSRPRRGRPHEPHDRGDVSRQGRRNRRRRDDRAHAQASLYGGAVLRRAAVEPGRAARGDRAHRRGAVAAAAAARLPLPPALPARDGRLLPPGARARQGGGTARRVPFVWWGEWRIAKRGRAFIALQDWKEDAMKSRRRRFLAVLCVAAMAVPAAGETPKRGGILTFMIPADAPPSFDAHRETTYATVHAAAP